nr:excalibur calcium-binding domain-containing protein [Streptomyces zinciresistens]
MPQPPRRAPGWARKRYALPALGLAFLLGIAMGGASGQDRTGADAEPAAASPRPTVTVTATTEPAPAPTVTLTATATATATKTVEVTAAPPAAADDPSDGGSGGGGGGGGDSVYYANCSEVRAAGAAPIRRGEPGYASHLDRDNDGVACDT